MLRILHVLDYYPFYVGKVVYEIANRLSSNDMIVKVASSNLMNGYRNCEDNERVIRLRAKRIVVRDTPYIVYDLRDFGLLKRQLEEVDIVHVHFLYKFLSLSIGAMKKIRWVQIPIVATSHGLTSGYPSREVQVTAKLLNGLAKRLVIENSSVITTVSKLEYNYLVKSNPTKKLCYIPNGVDTSFFKVDDDKRRKLRDKLGIGESDFLVLYFTRLRVTKGVFTFLRAMEQVVKKSDTIKFIVAGSGPLTDYVRKVKGKFGNRIRTFLGYVPDEDLPGLYNASDVYVLPSYVEGMPLSIMEAMACGKPVIATNVGDMPILVKNGVNGNLLPPGNVDLLAQKILRLVEDLELRNLMSKANVRKMAEYDWDKITKQYRALYSRMLET